MNMGKDVTAEMVEQVSPDAVILAAGSLQVLPRIPG